MSLYIDFETCNGAGVDLTKVGAHVYAAHPDTEIIMMSYAFGDEPVQRWFPEQPFPERVKDHVSTDGEVHAHNAQFERLMWQEKLSRIAPTPNLLQWRCTAAQCRANGLPGKLDKAAKVAGLNVLKDEQGHRLMLKMTKQYGLDHDRRDIQRLAIYCDRDVEVERELAKLLPPLTDDELYTYILNERMNDRGIMVDLDFCRAIREHMHYDTEQLNAELAQITGGDVTAFTQVQRLKNWLAGQCYYVPSLDKRAINLDDFDGEARRAIEIRQMGAKSSAAKYEALQRQAGPDARVRGMCQFAGAGQTGRFSSTGAQLHNLPRDVLPDAHERIEAFKSLTERQYRLVYDEPIIHTASRLLRPTLMAEDGKVFIVGDWSGVEARCVPWLAGHTDELARWEAHDADPTVPDPYVIDAAAIGSENRQVGKVVRLALQFCGGAGALMQMGAQYGMTFEPAQADQIVVDWREANPWVIKYGDKLERAAKRAVSRLNEVIEVDDKVSYGATEVNGKVVLRCLLPSGRVISYYDVKAKRGKYGMSLSAVKPREGRREDLWRGIFVENVAQATCNDFLRFTMAQCQQRQLPLVWHVHDEIVLEMEPRDGLVDEVRSMMEIRPDWAKDFPLVAEVDAKTRYSK